MILFKVAIGILPVLLI